MPCLLELHVAAKVNKLPVEKMEDQSLVFPDRAIVEIGLAKCLACISVDVPHPELTRSKYVPNG